MSSSQNDASRPDEDGPGCRLYLISPPAIELDPFAGALEAALDAGDVAAFQLRLPEADDDALRRAIDRLLPLTLDRDVAFILNDRPDLAAAMECDGVHIGQEDMPYAEARHLMGPDAIIGVTCHASRHLAMEAGEQGADYVAFGPFFPSLTKDRAAAGEKAEWATPDLIAWWAEMMEIPCVAIGGLTVGNCGPVIAAGADFLAVSNAVWAHPEGAAMGVKALNGVMDS